MSSCIIYDIRFDVGADFKTYSEYFNSKNKLITEF